MKALMLVVMTVTSGCSGSALPALEPLAITLRVDGHIPVNDLNTALAWWSEVGVSASVSPDKGDITISELLHVQLRTLAGSDTAVGYTANLPSWFEQTTDIILDFEWMQSAPSTLRSVNIAHELGHAFGLADVTDPNAIMSPTLHVAYGLSEADILEYRRTRMN